MVFVVFTCSKMQGCRFASSHVFGAHIHRIHEFLHPGNITISAGFKQLPERTVCTAASRVPAARVGRRTGTGAATFGGGRGASTAASGGAAAAAAGGAAAATGSEGQSRGGCGGRGWCYLTVTGVLHRGSVGKGAGIINGC